MILGTVPPNFHNPIFPANSPKKYLNWLIRQLSRGGTWRGDAARVVPGVGFVTGGFLGVVSGVRVVAGWFFCGWFLSATFACSDDLDSHRVGVVAVVGFERVGAGFDAVRQERHGPDARERPVVCGRGVELVDTWFVLGAAVHATLERDCRLSEFGGASVGGGLSSSFDANGWQTI